MDKMNFKIAEDVFEIFYKENTQSTNIDARQMAENGAKEGTVVIAESQTGGKGTRGRSFSSPKGTGLYMSLLLRPELEFSKALSITCAASVAVCRAIEQISGEKVYIKWVNDIYSEDNKKLCGILTEAVLNDDNCSVKYVVLGIGINVFEPDGGFSDEIKDIAGAVFKNEEKNDELKQKLTKCVLKEFWRLYEKLLKGTFLEEYRQRSCILGKKIDVIKDNFKKSAVALDINDDFSLKVRFSDGSEETLYSGDVSIKKITKN